MNQFFYNLVKPRSKDEDTKRQEFILNILLAGVLVLAFMAFLSAFFASIAVGEYRGVPVLFILILFLIFLGLYKLSRLGYYRTSSYILISFFLIPSAYTALYYGFETPQVLLTYSVVIIMSGILISTRFSWIVTLAITTLTLGFAYLQIQGTIKPNLYWKKETAGVDDAFVFVFSFINIMIVAWLSNREIEKSLKRARRSEAALKKERDLLEVKVEERTRALKESQAEKMTQLSRFAEFGRLASGVFHDLINPLTIVSLNLENIKDSSHKELNNVNSSIKRATDASRRMESFILAIKRQLSQQGSLEKFNVCEEIRQVAQILSFKAQKADVSIKLKGKNDVFLYGNSLKFYQVVSNIISNAIDAYYEFGSAHNRIVSVDCVRKGKKFRITIQDWGKGIASQNKEKIFTPFFTTKDVENGTGIGLSIAKEAVEKDFGGTISVNSTVGKGTVFTIDLPIIEPKKDD